MQLLTDEVRRTLPPLGHQSEVEDPIAYVKFFTPDAQWTWWATEGEPDGEEFIFFGFVRGVELEWGSFCLSELESARGPWGLPVERDLHFKPRPMSEVLREAL